MKEIFRKPFFLILIVVLLFSGVVLTSLLAYNMQKNRKTIDMMYEDTEIIFRVLPGTEALSNLELPVKTAERLSEFKEINSVYCELQCPAVLAKDAQCLAFPTAYGTNNLEKFAETRKILINREKEINTESDAFCILEEEFASTHGIGIGDEIWVGGCVIEYVLEDEAVLFPVTVMGTYQSDEMWPLDNAVILSDKMFYEENKLIYNQNMAERYQYYREFELTMDSVYNRKYNQVQEELQNTVGDSRNYMIHSNSRILERTVQPLEQRLDMQSVLSMVLGITFVFAGTMFVILLTIKRGNSILIRLVMGEEYYYVCMSEWIFICVSVILSMLPAILFLLVLQILGLPIGWSVKMLVIFSITSVLVSLLTIIISNRGGLLRLYQTRNRNE